jgi:hypothetical protein
MSPQISLELLQGINNYRKVNYRGKVVKMAEGLDWQGFPGDVETVLREFFSA